MSKLSRRSLVSSAAALPARTVPAVASPLLAEADTELLQLGVRLLKVHRALDALEADPLSTDEAWEQQLSEQAALVLAILSLTATTREGVTVQAAAAIRACGELWHESTDDGDALDAERPFLEAIARYCGITAPVKQPYRPYVDEGACHE
jgi:hypothetical protein